MSQADLCRKLGKHQVWASQRERGHTPVRGEDVPGLADALQVDAEELRTMASHPSRPAGPAPTVGDATGEPVTSRAGGRAGPIEELSRDDLLGAVRSLRDANAAARAEFETVTADLVAMYEEKVRALYHALAASVELGIRDAVRDKMDVILAAVTAAAGRRPAAAGAGPEPEVAGSNAGAGG